MKKGTTIYLIAIVLLATQACAQKKEEANSSAAAKVERGDVISLSEADWKSKLTPEQYYVLREQGTERAFTGKYWDNREAGTYTCAACDLPLFDSATKFKSGTGWPSFYEPLKAKNVKEAADRNYGMRWPEVSCARCGGHLGHVFPDGPKPTGLRYCINSVSLGFIPKD